MPPSAFSRVTSHLVRKTNHVTGLRNRTEKNTRCGTKGNFINLDYERNWPTTQRKHQEQVVFKQGSQQKLCLLHNLFTMDTVPTGHKQCSHIHPCFPIVSHARTIWLLFPWFKLSHLNYGCCFLSAFKDKGLVHQIPSLLYFSSLQNALFPPHHRYLSPLSTLRGRSLCQAPAWPLPPQDQQLWSHTEEPHKIGPTQFPHGGDIWPMVSQTKTRRAGEMVLPRAS